MAVILSHFSVRRSRKRRHDSLQMASGSFTHPMNRVEKRFMYSRFPREVTNFRFPSEAEGSPTGGEMGKRSFIFRPTENSWRSQFRPLDQNWRPVLPPCYFGPSCQACSMPEVITCPPQMASDSSLLPIFPKTRVLPSASY